MSEIITPRLRLLPLTRQQLRWYLHAPKQLERELGLTLSRAVLTDPVKREIGIKIGRLGQSMDKDWLWSSDWLIVISEAGFGAGLAGFKGAPDELGQVEIGCDIDPGAQDQGYASEAVCTLIEWALQDPRCSAIQAPGTLKSNLPSNWLLQNIGMEIYAETEETNSWRITRQMVDREKVGDMLQAFQDGYTARNLEGLDQFMQLFDASDALELTGTGGVQPGDNEWSLGVAAVRKLVESDWQFWGDLRLNLAGAHIHTSGDTAWLSTSGTISMLIEKEPGYQNFLNYVRWLLDEQPGLGAETIVMDILRGGSNTLFELHKGSSFSWPLGFSAVLVRRAVGWRFHQVTFSYPTTRFPDVRNEP